MKNDCTVLHTLLSSMQNDIMVELSHYQTTNAMWEALKVKFGDIYDNKVAKCANHTMNHHLKVMSNMIRELKAVGNNLIDE